MHDHDLLQKLKENQPAALNNRISSVEKRFESQIETVEERLRSADVQSAELAKNISQRLELQDQRAQASRGNSKKLKQRLGAIDEKRSTDAARLLKAQERLELQNSQLIELQNSLKELGGVKTIAMVGLVIACIALLAIAFHLLWAERAELPIKVTVTSQPIVIPITTKTPNFVTETFVAKRAFQTNKIDSFVSCDDESATNQTPTLTWDKRLQPILDSKHLLAVIAQAGHDARELSGTGIARNNAMLAQQRADVVAEHIHKLIPAPKNIMVQAHARSARSKKSDEFCNERTPAVTVVYHDAD